MSSGSDDAVGELGGAKIIGCRCDDRPGRLVGNVGGVSLGSRGVHGHQEEDQDRALGHVNLHAQVLDGSIRRRNLGVAAPESERYREREMRRDQEGGSGRVWETRCMHGPVYSPLIAWHGPIYGRHVSVHLMTGQ